MCGCRTASQHAETIALGVVDPSSLYHPHRGLLWWAARQGAISMVEFDHAGAGRSLVSLPLRTSRHVHHRISPESAVSALPQHAAGLS